MEKHSKDIFEAKNSNFLSKTSETNFFISEDNFVPTDIKIKKERQRRLNDYDFNLLKEDAYKDISDDLFKLEYKISKTEEEIAYLSCQLQSAKEINDLELIEELSRQKEMAEDDYSSLVSFYNEKSLSARMTDSISNIFGNKIKNNYNNLQIKFQNITQNIIKKLPKKITSIIEIKSSLNKLESINRSVDELISMNIPYGENLNKYEQLSKYIIKANEIQGEISKYIKK